MINKASGVKELNVLNKTKKVSEVLPFVLI